MEIKTDFNLSNLSIFTSLEQLAVCIRLLSYDNVFSSESLKIAEINIGKFDWRLFGKTNNFWCK